MLILNKQNMVPYLQEHYPDFRVTDSLTISEIGDNEEDNPGLINHIFRVSSGTQSMIVKQGLEQIRIGGNYRLPPARNRQEYLSLKLRSGMVSQYIPKVYGRDFRNNVFCMEDVSYLGNARVELSKGVMFPNLARQCAEYIAASTFYTSEFYLDTPTFRALSNAFTNTEMRRVMEQWVFLRESPFPDNPEMAWLRKTIEEDKEAIAQIYLLRHQFMSRPEGMIHADLHTSNIFLDNKNLKVIDMEYTFAGPICYDVGYFTNSILTQLCASWMRPFPSEEERRTFQTYLISTIVDTYNHFVSFFKEYWEKDAKACYRKCPPWRDKLIEGFLPDILGYAAVPTFPPILSGGEGWLDFTSIPDPKARLNAKYLAIAVSGHLLTNRFRYHSMEEAAADILKVSLDFLNRLS